jgi:hypothetical protein
MRMTEKINGALETLRLRLRGALEDIKSVLSGNELDKEKSERLYFCAMAIDRFLEAEV